MLTLLLALVLLLSLAITASAEENQDHAPYLSYCELRDDGEGWCESTEGDFQENLELHTLALDHAWVVFYLNTWDEDGWVSQPIDIETDDANLRIERFRDTDEYTIREGEANASYFCRVIAQNTMDEAETELYYMHDGQKLTLPVYIHQLEAGWFTAPTASVESHIDGYDFYTDALAEENSFYYIFRSEYWQEVEDSFFCGVNFWNEDGLYRVDDEAVADFVTAEPVGNGVYKIIVNPDFVRSTTGNWANFELIAGVEAVGDNEETVFERGIWVHPGNSHNERAAYISINGKEFLFYEDSDVIGTWEPQFTEDGEPLYNEWGDHITYWVKTEMPTGVSYDLGSNTLTLNNASLQNLNVYYHWVNYDENGDIALRDDGTTDEGWNLPNADLTIKLIGSNQIVCDYGPALSLENELNVTINGTGSLLVKAVNSPNNMRTEYHWNSETEQDEEIQVYNTFDALLLNNGSNLTIAGNAKVTAEIEGTARETIWDENGPTDQYETAFLSAVRGNEGDLLVKGNATLTTVLPEDARDNGPLNDQGNTNGGYRGLEYFKNITIQDNATVTTSSLWMSNDWIWNEETQQGGPTWTGSYTQTGGTMNITALGSINYDVDENGDSVANIYYCGFSLEYGTANISGGTLNVEAIPAASEENVWAEAIPFREGKLNVTGGTVNVDVSNGQALSVPCGDLVISGGTVNLNTFDSDGIVVGEWGDDPYDDYNPDGTLAITGGTVNINCENSGTPTSALQLLYTTKSAYISDGEVNITDGMADIYSSFDISGGKIELNATSNVPYYGAFGFINMDAESTMSGGQVIINTQNYYLGFVNSGVFRQTGGEITVNAGIDEAWRAANTDEDGNAPIAIGFLSDGHTSLTGGTMTVTGADWGLWHAINGYVDMNDDGEIIVDMLDDRKLEVDGDAVLNVTGGSRGILLEGIAEFKGGNVNATATGIADSTSFGICISSTEGDHNYWDEDQTPYHIDNYTSLSITGGTHSFSAPTDSIRGTGIMSICCPAVTIENATVEVTGGRSIFTVNDQPVEPLDGSWYLISMASGEALDFQTEHYTFEDEGETIDEYIYFIEEDNTLGSKEEGYDFSTHVLLLPDNKCGDNAYWEIDDGVLTISGEGAMYDFAPDFQLAQSTAPWTPVKQVIEEVVVEEGITYVGAWSFAWLENLTHISYPASLTEIGSASVVQTTSLTGYTIASGCERYASPDGISIVDLEESRLHTVAQAAPGKTYTVPEGVTVIGGSAVFLCGFEEVIIPEGVTEIMVAAFEGCPNLKTVTLPESLTTLADAVFVGCTNLETVTIPKSVTAIGASVFGGCDNVTVTVYCETAGETYVEENGIRCEVIHTCGEDDPSDPTDPTEPGYTIPECKKDSTCVMAKFPDLVTSEWYHDGVHFCIEEGLMNGMDTGDFQPGGNTTRAQLVTILYREAGSPDVSSVTEPFSDVAEADWFYKAVVWAYNNGVVNGTSDTTFSPNDNVTREQVATILYRYSGSPVGTGDLSVFPDVNTVSSYAVPALTWAVGEGLINGVAKDGVSTLDPTGNATRAQIATILMRYLTA